jgi:hypothetical protein
MCSAIDAESGIFWAKTESIDVKLCNEINWLMGIGSIVLGCCLCMCMLRMVAHVLTRPQANTPKPPYLYINPLKYMGNVLARYWLIGTEKTGYWHGFPRKLGPNK